MLKNALQEGLKFSLQRKKILLAKKKNYFANNISMVRQGGLTT